MVPGYLHTATMQCQAASTCEHQVLNLETGEKESKAEFTSLQNLFMHTLAHKHVPFAKVMVPTGLDDQGRFVLFDVCQFLGASRHFNATLLVWQHIYMCV